MSFDSFSVWISFGVEQKKSVKVFKRGCYRCDCMCVSSYIVITLVVKNNVQLSRDSDLNVVMLSLEKTKKLDTEGSFFKKLKPHPVYVNQRDPGMLNWLSSSFLV